MNDSKNVLDFYIKNNNKKYLIKKQNKERNLSVAEYSVLSCINAISMYSEMYPDMDIDKVIKMIILKDLSEEDLKSLKKKDELLSIKKEYNNLTTTDSLVACQSCGMTGLDIGTSNSAYPKIHELYEKYKKLQTTIRTGHIYWGVNADRKESILEHIYGTLLLCIGMESEYNYYVDFNKVLKMLLLHETEEILIGDKTSWDISKEEKKKQGERAVDRILVNLIKYDEFKSLINEFNNNSTIESNYANLCDKLEYDLQVKMYQDLGYYNMNNLPRNVVTESNEVKEIIDNGANSVFDIHYEYDKNKYVNYPSVRKILELTKNN